MTFMGIDIEDLCKSYRAVMARSKQTNFERIKAMDISEFIAFLKSCKFDSVFPVIEGNRFYTDEDLTAWLNKEASSEVP